MTNDEATEDGWDLRQVDMGQAAEMEFFEVTEVHDMKMDSINREEAARPAESCSQEDLWSRELWRS